MELQVANPFPPITIEEKALYKKFIKATNEDPRYLRPDRWREIYAILKQYKLKSVLEFGAGISTMLFKHNGLSVTACETDMAYMKFVQGIAGNEIDFRVWNNEDSPISEGEKFDFGLVDGCLPRNRQAEIAIKHCRFVALDDSVRDIKRSLWTLFSPFERVDKETTIVSIFKIR